MSNEMFLDMVTSGDVSNITQDLVLVDSVNVIGGGKVACLVVTTNQYFTFKGELKVCCTNEMLMALLCTDLKPVFHLIGKNNEDRVVSTYVIEEMGNDDIKVVHVHRCTGVPIPL